MQARCKSTMQRYPGNASPHASPSTCTCKPDASPMQARCKPELAHAATCKSEIATQAHMQLTSYATHIHSKHIQLSHMQLSPATHTCNTTCISHTNMHSELISMACSRLTYRACTDYFSGLHVQLRCKAHAAISRQCKHACTGLASCLHVLASYLHRVCMGLHAHASPMQVRETTSQYLLILVGYPYELRRFQASEQPRALIFKVAVGIQI